MSLQLTAFASLVGRIYDCALLPERWPTTIDAVRAQLGYEIAIMAQHSFPDGRVTLDETANVAAEFEKTRIFFQQDAVALWGGPSFLQQYPVDAPAALSRINPRGMHDPRNAWVREWAAPQGLVDHLALVLARDGGAFGCVGFGRHRSHGTIDDDDVQAAALLVPHLQRAASIGRVLEAHAARALDLATALDCLTTPVFLLAADGRVLHRNTSAAALLELGTPLRLRAEKLGSPIPRVQEALESGLRGCASAVPDARRPFGIPARGDDGMVHALHLLPVSTGTSARRIDVQATAALFVSSPTASRGRSADLVKALYALTPAETRVFELISAGRTLQESAIALGISASTLKTHLLRIFTKVGVRRQADLVRLAAVLEPPVVMG